MAETVAESGYQQRHHLLSESNWDRRWVRRQLVADANDHFGYASGLLIDESRFARKGELSAGGARQWNGRLGRTDNCPVGVCAAIARDGVAPLVDTELYLPNAWTNDTARGDGAGVPEDRREFRTKGEVALELVRRLRRDGLRVSFVAFDGGYGPLPWLLRELDGEGETFLADVHSNPAITLDDPAPVAADVRSSPGLGMASRLRRIAGIFWCAGKSMGRRSSSVCPMPSLPLPCAVSRKCRRRAMSPSAPSRTSRVPAAWPIIRCGAGRHGTITWRS